MFCMHRPAPSLLTTLHNRDVNTPPSHTCHCTFHHSPRPCPCHVPVCATSLSMPPTHSCALISSLLPSNLAPPHRCHRHASYPQLSTPAASARHIPSGPPEASCQAHTPFLPTATPQMYFKGLFFPHSCPSLCLPSSPFSVVPNTSASSRSTFTSFSLPNLFGPFVTNSSIWAPSLVQPQSLFTGSLFARTFQHTFTCLLLAPAVLFPRRCPLFSFHILIYNRTISRLQICNFSPSVCLATAAVPKIKGCQHPCEMPRV